MLHRANLYRALTIHKSQGQTIERVRIDLQRVFVEGTSVNHQPLRRTDGTGQTYVAISRAVSLETLEIKNFKEDKWVQLPYFVPLHSLADY